MTDKLDQPESSAGDVWHTVVRAGLSAVPGFGGPAVELLGLIIMPPLERRRQQWMVAVADGLRKLEQQQQGFKIEALQDNPVFVDAVMQATQAALRTSQEEKLDALRNAVLNASLPNAPGTELQQLFIRFVDELTVWHLRVLTHFHDPGVTFRERGLGEGYYNPIHSFEQVFPELFADGRQDLLSIIWQDLVSRGLVAEGTAFTHRLFEGMWSSKLSSRLGDELLLFIRDPTARAQALG
jgi:hypothetical protein